MRSVDAARPGRWRAVAVVLAVTVAAVAGCGGGSGDGQDSQDGAAAASKAGTGAGVLGAVHRASGEPVKVGLVSDGKSPSVDQSIELAVAAATVKYVNERRGGIGGRPIELTTCETQLDPGRATDCADQMVEQQVAAVLVGSSGVLEDVWRPLHAAGVP